MTENKTGIPAPWGHPRSPERTLDAPAQAQSRRGARISPGASRRPRKPQEDTVRSSTGSRVWGDRDAVRGADAAPGARYHPPPQGNEPVFPCQAPPVLGIPRWARTRSRSVPGRAESAAGAQGHGRDKRDNERERRQKTARESHCSCCWWCRCSIGHLPFKLFSFFPQFICHLQSLEVK